MKYVLGFLMTFTVYAAHGANSLSMKGNDNVQVQEYTYDFAVDGGALGNIDISHGRGLPVGAQVLDVYWVVDTAFTSNGSATVGIGDATTTARYKALTAYNNSAYTAATIAKAAIGTPVTMAAAADGKPQIYVAVAALTAGKMKLVYTLYVPKH